MRIAHLVAGGGKSANDAHNPGKNLPQGVRNVLTVWLQMEMLLYALVQSLQVTVVFRCLRIELFFDANQDAFNE